jgi:signal transduction histidine kinase
MSIRQKLGIAFSVIAAIMILLAGLFVTGGPIMVKRFSRSLDAMEAFNLIRDFRSSLSRRHSSMNMYLLIGEPQTLNDFNDLSSETKTVFEGLLKNLNLAQHPAVSNINARFQTLNRLNDRVISLYRGGEKARALALADQESFPQYEQLLDRVKELEKSKQSEAQENFESFRRVAQRGAIIILLTTVMAIALTLIFLGNLYKAVMNPLETLRRGALELGEGHWDHRISVPAKNEFDTLAKAFNTMAANIRQLQLQTIHMERMSTVGQLAGGVAHELNNPLTGVLGHAQLLLTSTPSDKPEWNQLKKIEQAALRCKRIVRGLLDFSRPQEGQLQPTPINELLLTTMELCETDIKAAKIHIHKKLDPGLPPVNANAPQIEQVLLNLITNALHAMKEGGTLTLQTDYMAGDLTLPDRRMGQPRRKLPGPWVKISVSDTGCGIPEEILDKIFEPFYTTKDIGKGTGLGLAIVLGIVRKHGGDIRAESGGSGKGATFNVYLPVAGSLRIAETHISTPA